MSKGGMQAGRTGVLKKRGVLKKERKNEGVEN